MAVEFCILTATCSGEVLGARWSKIGSHSLPKAIWRLSLGRRLIFTQGSERRSRLDPASLPASSARGGRRRTLSERLRQGLRPWLSRWQWWLQPTATSGWMPYSCRRNASLMTARLNREAGRIRRRLLAPPWVAGRQGGEDGGSTYPKNIRTRMFKAGKTSVHAPR